MKAMPFSEYQDIGAVNFSSLKEMRRSPLHYHHRLKTPREDSSRLALGRACHTAVYEPRRFMLDYACYKGGIRRGKAWDAFEEQHQDQTILKVSEYELCLAVADAVHAHPEAAALLKKGKCEQVIQWTDPNVGLKCKGRVDWISESVADAFADVKTTSTIDAAKFAATSHQMGYFAQTAFYRTGIMCSLGRMYTPYVIAVEIAAPHDVAVFEIDEDSLYAGEQEYIALLEKVKKCQETGQWPGRYPSKEVLRMPKWAWNDDDEDASGLDLLINGQDATSNGEVSDGA